ncbi:MAG: hypothetical protein Kow0089_23610 [Desulfobulbaceae bacterium]
MKITNRTNLFVANNYFTSYVMEPLERTVARTIEREGLVREGEGAIVVALSGGPDSMALLHLLLPWCRENEVRLSGAYIDHGLRPAENTIERELVRNVCEDNDVSFAHERIAVREYARERKISLEHAARDLRYGALRRIAREQGAQLIAVGHTADDQAEEILLRLLRGGGRKGLSGMRYRNGDIIRPLLEVERARLLEYLGEKNISYHLDSSNTDMRFLRNRVRHILLPLLEAKFESGIKNSLRKTASSLAEDEGLLEELTIKALDDVMLSSEPDEPGTGLRGIDIDRQGLNSLHPALRRRVLEQLLWRLGCRARFDHIMKIVDASADGRTGSELHLSKGLRVGVLRDRLTFSYPRGRKPWRGRLFA